MKNNEWISIKNQSLAAYTREAGFDISIYDEYSKETKIELKRRAINSAIYNIIYQFEEKCVEIRDIRKGLYVISLSSPLTISYNNKNSQVIYIGRGYVISRIKSHFNNSLFDFMQSLTGANFDFHIARPANPKSDRYHIHVEWQMLEYFSEIYGSKPILNKNKGSAQGINSNSIWWKSPLQVRGRRPRWELRPTNFSEFALLD